MTNADQTLSVPAIKDGSGSLPAMTVHLSLVLLRQQGFTFLSDQTLAGNSQVTALMLVSSWFKPTEFNIGKSLLDSQSTKLFTVP